LPLPPNDPAIEAIAERLRVVIAQQPSPRLNDLADSLGLDRDSFSLLINEQQQIIDVTFLIDVVAAVVHGFGVDPQWLLTGRYDASIHRRALLLGEDRSPQGVHALRAYIAEQYRKLRDTTLSFIRGSRLPGISSA
jgi:hypothetical protein